MYTVHIGATKIFDLRVDGLKLMTPRLNHEINKAGSFTFTIRPDHPYIGVLQKMKIPLTIEDDDEIIWRGRILKTVEKFNKDVDVTCEGEMAFFNDTRIRKYDYTGDLAGYFSLLIEQHNSNVEEFKRFKVGNITVKDDNDYLHFSSIQYPDTLSEINEKVLKRYGGYIYFRHEQDGVYIDYLKDSDLLCNQDIQFGTNMLDFSNTVDGTDVKTVIIPLGAMNDEDEQRLTIESVNEGKDYVVNEEAAALFGYISEVVEFDDVTEPQNLLRKGKEYASDLGNLIHSMTITAADLHKMGSSLNSYKLFRYVNVSSKLHNLNEKYLITKISINLSNPLDGRLTVGNTFKSLIDKQLEYNGKYDQIIKRVEHVENNFKINEGALRENWAATDKAIQQLREDVTSQLDQTAESVKISVKDELYAEISEDVDKKISEKSTEWEQTAEGWNLTFNEFRTLVDEYQNGNNEAFNEIQKYIRFVDGNIVLGNTESPLVLRIMNDRIQFLQDGYEVAYISDRKMYNTICEITNKLIIGDVAWMVESNADGYTVVSLAGI